MSKQRDRRKKIIKILRENGEFLGSGSQREAYLYNGKVYKFSLHNSLQDYFEKRMWENMPEKFKTYFPNPNFIGRIVQMDYVTIAEQLSLPYNENEFGEERWKYSFTGSSESEDKITFSKEFRRDGSSFNHKNFIYHSSIGRVIRKFGPNNFNYDTFQELLDWLASLGSFVVDILDVPSNFGIDENNNLKIVDWGWSQNDADADGDDYY